MRFYEFEAKEDSLTPGPSPAVRERGGSQGRGEGSRPPLRPTPAVRERARHLRLRATGSEQLLWEALRNRGQAGRKFRRQHPLGRFILDFYCHEDRLAIEVDGGVHLARGAADRERQHALESMGVRVVRLPATLIKRDLAAALAIIGRALTPGPSPAQRERGDPEPVEGSG